MSGPTPRERDGTRRVLPTVDEDTETASTEQPHMVNLSGETARIRMKFKSDCLVGRWKIILQVSDLFYNINMYI